MKQSKPQNKKDKSPIKLVAQDLNIYFSKEVINGQEASEKMLNMTNH